MAVTSGAVCRRRKKISSAARLLQMITFLLGICSLDSRSRFEVDARVRAAVAEAEGGVGQGAEGNSIITTTKFDRAACYIQIYKVNNLMVRN